MQLNLFSSRVSHLTSPVMQTMQQGPASSPMLTHLPPSRTTMTLHWHNNSAFATCAPTNPKRKCCYCSWAKVHRLKCDQCFRRQYTFWVQQKPTHRSQTQSHMMSNTCTQKIFLSVYDFWNVFKITTRATRATRIHLQCGHLLNTPKTCNAPQMNADN